MKVLTPTRFSLFSLLLVCALLIAACKNIPSVFCDNDENIRIGKEYYQPLIEALEKYKTDHGNYPEKFAQLAPRYLPVQAINDDDDFKGVSLPAEVSVGYAGSRPDEHAFVISFNFRRKAGCSMFRGGMCDYYSDTKSWSCK